VADDVHLGGTLGRYAVKDLKGQAIAVIDDRTAYGQGVAEEFEKAVKAAGGKLVGHEFTNDKASDFMAILTTLKAKKPDIVFFGGMDAVAGPMMRQMKSLGMNAKFMGGDGICTGELAKLAGDAMVDGQVVCAEAGGVDGQQKKSMEDFGVKYKKRFNDDVKLYAPYVYDAVNVLVDISGLRAAEAARAATEARFQAVQEVSPDGFLVLDACRNAAGEPVDFTIAYANPTAAGMLGAHRDSLDGALLSALQCGDKAWANGLVGGFLEVLRTGQSLLRELRYEGPEGPVWISSRAVPLGDGVAVALEDITARCAAQERIRELRRQDPLTGLANRHSFQAALTAALSDPAATSVGVLLTPRSVPAAAFA
jgi:PAS domain-containing protein